MMKNTYLMLVCLLCTTFLFAQNNDFNNNGGDLLWSNPLNWSLGAVPSAANTVRLPLIVTSQVDTDVTVKKIQTTFATSGDASVGGASTLTINPAVLNAYAVENVSNNNVTLGFNGNVTLNNSAGFSRMRHANGTNNTIEFASGSVFTLNSPLEIFTGSSMNFNFNGSLAGSGNFRLSANTSATFGSTSSNPNYTGEFVFLLNSVLTVNTADNNVFYNGFKLQANGNNASIVLNGANVLASNIAISANNAFTVNANKNQSSLGTISLGDNSTMNLVVGNEVTNLSFANNSATTWNAGTLNITGFQSGVIRFGTDATGLSEAQLLQIVADNGVTTVVLDENGYLVDPNAVSDPSIAATSCNTTLNSAATEYVFADEFANATQYEFKIVNGMNEQTIVRNTNSFRFGDLGFDNFTYGTTYDVSVRAYVNDTWTEYGASCPITLTANPTTSMDGFCDLTMPSINSKIYFFLVPQATEYRYSVTNVLTEVEQFVTTDIRFFYITDVANYDFNTQYSIKCQVKIDGQFGDFGPACTLTTAAAPTVQLRSQFCDTNLSSLNANIYADYLVGATAYKFKLENGGNEQEIERPDSRFSMAFASNIMPFTTYNVSVAVYFNGAWQPYGNVCTVATPALPTSQLRSQYCGGSVATLGSNFYANFVSGANAYRFKTMINGEEMVVERPDSRCFMSAFAGAMMNETYAIQVAVQIGDVWGEYGNACNLSVGETLIGIDAMRQISDDINLDFDVQAFPNPFSNQFSLILSSNAQESIVTVFDMTGKQIEQIRTSDTKVTINPNWTAGIYIVQIEQGSNTRTLRMVKQ